MLGTSLVEVSDRETPRPWTGKWSPKKRWNPKQAGTQGKAWSWKQRQAPQTSGSIKRSFHWGEQNSLKGTCRWLWGRLRQEDTSKEEAWQEKHKDFMRTHYVRTLWHRMKDLPLYKYSLAPRLPYVFAMPWMFPLWVRWWHAYFMGELYPRYMGWNVLLLLFWMNISLNAFDLNWSWCRPTNNAF